MLCLLVQVGARRSAFAQDFAAAGQHFSAAQDAFQLGQYKQAAQEYQAAYDITKDGALLFNIGESWQRAGETAKALAAYQAYLKDPAQGLAGDRQEVEKRIAALSGAAPTPASAGETKPLASEASPKVAPAEENKPPAAVKSTASKGPPELNRAPAAATSSRLRTAAWVSVAAAVALATAGAIMGLGAQNRADELQRRTTLLVNNQPPVYDDDQRDAYESLMTEGNAYNTAAIALLSVAGAAAVTSTALFIADWVKRPKSERSRLASSPIPSLVLGGNSVLFSIGGGF
jgi:hypothetical protein